MAPPQLAADAPILNVLEPMAISILVLGRVEADFIVHHRCQGQVGKVFHLDEPLHGEFRLDGYVGSLGEAHIVGVGFHLLHQSGPGKVFLNLVAHLEAIHSHIETGLGRKRTVRVEDVDRGQVVLFAQHVVVDIMGRRHLETTRTKLNVDILVFNHRNHAAHQRHDDLLAAQPLVLGVVGIDAHGRIAHDSLGTRGSHHGILVGRTALDTIFQIIELAVLLLINHFLVRERRLSLGIPVDHSDSAINQSLAIKVAEHFDDALRAHVVHRKGRAVPVTRSSQLTQLLQDNATVLIGPGPGMLQELLAGEVFLANALLGKSVHHLSLGSDACMVGTGHPAGIVALHTGAANQNILNGFVQHVAHMQHAGHIGRRYHHRERFAPIGL